MGQFLGVRGGASLANVKPQILDIVKNAIAAQPYAAEIISGSEHRTKDLGNHGPGYALDVQLYKPDANGKLVPLPNEGTAAYSAYEAYAQAARVYQQQKYPDLPLRTGLGFNTTTTSNIIDPMHLDIRPGGGMSSYSWDKGGLGQFAIFSNGGLAGANGPKLVSQYQTALASGIPTPSVNVAQTPPIPLPRPAWDNTPGTSASAYAPPPQVDPRSALGAINAATRPTNAGDSLAFNPVATPSVSLIVGDPVSTRFPEMGIDYGGVPASSVYPPMDAGYNPATGLTHPFDTAAIRANMVPAPNSSGSPNDRFSAPTLTPTNVPVYGSNMGLGMAPIARPAAVSDAATQLRAALAGQSFSPSTFPDRPSVIGSNGAVPSILRYEPTSGQGQSILPVARPSVTVPGTTAPTNIPVYGSGMGLGTAPIAPLPQPDPRLSPVFPLTPPPGYGAAAPTNIPVYGSGLGLGTTPIAPTIAPPQLGNLPPLPQSDPRLSPVIPLAPPPSYGAVAPTIAAPATPAPQFVTVNGHVYQVGSILKMGKNAYKVQPDGTFVKAVTLPTGGMVGSAINNALKDKLTQAEQAAPAAIGGALSGIGGMFGNLFGNKTPYGGHPVPPMDVPIPQIGANNGGWGAYAPAAPLTSAPSTFPSRPSVIGSNGGAYTSGSPPTMGDAATQLRAALAGQSVNSPNNVGSGVPYENSGWQFNAPSVASMSPADLTTAAAPAVPQTITQQVLNPAYAAWMNNTAQTSPFTNPGIQGLSPDDRQAQNDAANAASLSAAARAYAPPKFLNVTKPNPAFGGNNSPNTSPVSSQSGNAFSQPTPVQLASGSMANVGQTFNPDSTGAGYTYRVNADGSTTNLTTGHTYGGAGGTQAPIAPSPNNYGLPGYSVNPPASSPDFWKNLKNGVGNAAGTVWNGLPAVHLFNGIRSLFSGQAPSVTPPSQGGLLGGLFGGLTSPGVPSVFPTTGINNNSAFPFASAGNVNASAAAQMSPGGSLSTRA